MSEIDKVLAERGSRYGDFADHAVVAQALQNVMRKSGKKVQGDDWDKLSDVQKQALTVIADKIARILSGDPNYDDNWIDIQGYAKLAQDRLPKKEQAKDATLPSPAYSGIPDIRQALGRTGLGDSRYQYDSEAKREGQVTTPTCVCN